MATVLSFDELFGWIPFQLGQEDTETDAVSNYTDCVDSQSDHMDLKIQVCNPSEERKQTPIHEEQCVSADVSGDADSIVPSARGENKHKGRVIKLKDEQLDLQCGWQDCDYCTGNLEHFVRHVSFHLPHVEIKVYEDQKGTGSVLFPRILPASNATWQCHLCNHMLAHINFCSLLKYFKSI
jgi:hypothetical protein